MDAGLRRIEIGKLPEVVPFAVWELPTPSRFAPTASVVEGNRGEPHIVKVTYVVDVADGRLGFLVLCETADAFVFRNLPVGGWRKGTEVVADGRNEGAHYGRTKRGETHIVMWATPGALTASEVAMALDSLTPVAA